MVEAYTFSVNGEIVEITVSGEVDGGAGSFGPDGHTFIREDLMGSSNEAFLAMEERILDLGGYVGSTQKSDLVPRTIGIFGAFVPESKYLTPNFQAFNEDQTEVGIPSSSIFFIGAGPFKYRAAEPGKLFLGVADSYASNNNGSFTATIEASVDDPGLRLPSTVVFVHALQNGRFGFPSQNGSAGGRDFLPACRLRSAGEFVKLRASGHIIDGANQRGPEGADYPRAGLMGSFDQAYSPLEEGRIARGEDVPTMDGDTVSPNVGGLIGIFVPDSEIPENFRALDDERHTGTGLQASDLFFVGEQLDFLAPGPGMLFLGVNNSWNSAWSGAFKVEITREPEIEIQVSKEEIREGEDFELTINLSEPPSVDTEIALELPTSQFSYAVPVVIPAGERITILQVTLVDDQLITKNYLTEIVASAESYSSGRTAITVLDNDWNGFDENQNQMSDIWERFHGIYGADPDEDLDGDGFSNFLEDKWGTDPNDGSSLPRLRIDLARSSDTEICFLCDLIKGKRAILYGSADLKTFEPVGVVFESPGGEVEMIVQLTGDYQYFRLAAVMSEDKDSDGLPDDDETLLNTDPLDSDSDDDGASDGFEMSRFIDLNVYGLRNRAGDSQGEGNPPVAAAEGESAPRLGDRGLPPFDGPNDPDTDDDGVLDGYQPILFVASGSATNTKPGIPSYHDQTVGGPIPGESVVRYYLNEVRSWGAPSIVALPQGLSCPIGGRFPGGTYTRAYRFTEDGRIQYEESTTDEWLNSVVGIGNPRPRVNPPAWDAKRGSFGDALNFSDDYSSYDSSYSWQTRHICFDADGRGSRPLVNFQCAASGLLSDEFTTERNIEFTYAKAKKNAIGWIASTTASGAIRIPESFRIGGGFKAAWEKNAEVDYAEYAFATASGIDDLKIFKITDIINLEEEVEQVGFTGNLPTITNKENITSIIYFIPPKNEGLKDEFFCPGGALTWTISSGGDAVFLSNLKASDFVVTPSDRASWSWDPERKKLSVTLSDVSGESISIAASFRDGLIFSRNLKPLSINNFDFTLSLEAKEKNAILLPGEPYQLIVSVVDESPFLLDFINFECSVSQLLHDGTLGRSQIVRHEKIGNLLKITPPGPGIFTVKVKASICSLEKRVSFIREDDAHCAEESKYTGITPSLRRGAIDFFGVARSKAQQKLAIAAKEKICNTEFAKRANYMVYEGAPDLTNSWKCNIFVYAISIAAGTPVPLSANWRTGVAFPPKANTWGNENAIIPGWRYLGKINPEPGLVGINPVFSLPFVYSASGHMGIIGHNGALISAREFKVDQSIHVKKLSEYVYRIYEN